jgi:ankyrin repeat protein
MKYIKKYENKLYFDDFAKEIVNATANDNAKKLKQLIKKHEDYNIDFSYNQGFTPLLYAALYNSNNTLKVLVNYGANVNKQNDKGDTPIILASSPFIKSELEKSLKIIKILIKAGADLNIKNNNNKDLFDIADNNIKEFIKLKYPKKYQEYLMKKNAEKYNL